MQRNLIRTGLILGVGTALIIMLVGFISTTTVTVDPEISTMVSSVDSSRILNTAQTLQNFGTRQACSDLLAPLPHFGFEFVFSCSRKPVHRVQSMIMPDL